MGILVKLSVESLAETATDTWLTVRQTGGR